MGKKVANVENCKILCLNEAYKLFLSEKVHIVYSSYLLNFVSWLFTIWIIFPHFQAPKDTPKKTTDVTDTKDNDFEDYGSAIQTVEKKVKNLEKRQVRLIFSSENATNERWNIHKFSFYF